MPNLPRPAHTTLCTVIAAALLGLSACAPGSSDASGSQTARDVSTELGSDRSPCRCTSSPLRPYGKHSRKSSSGKTPTSR